MVESSFVQNSSAKNYMALCWEMEKSGKNSLAEEKWLGGISLYQNDLNYWENLVYFYYKQKKYHRVLEFFKKSENIGYNLSIRSMAIEAAFALGQYKLCYQIYLSLKKEDIAFLKKPLLLQIAQAAMEVGHYSEAENLLIFLAKKEGAKPLPDLKTLLISEFGTEKKIQEYMQSIESYLQNNSLFALEIFSLLRYATCLIHYGRYQEALAILEKYRVQFC